MKVTSVSIGAVLFLIAAMHLSCDSSSTLNASEHRRVVASGAEGIAASHGLAAFIAPRDYELTPYGYFHKSCIILVDTDEVVYPEGLIKRADGTSRRVRPCEYPAFDQGGDIRPDPTVNNWVADAQLNNVTVSYISAAWTVPSEPTNVASQILYFFPGLEPSDGQTILQPVLGWNAPDDPGHWSIQSWDCCDTNYNPYKSTVQRVQAIGDTISGFVSGTNCNATTGICSNWQVETKDTHGSTYITTGITFANYSRVVNYSFGGVLEAYNVDHCDEYPPSKVMTFSSVVLKDINGSTLTPSWTNTTYYACPTCFRRVSSNSSTVTISWDPDTCDCGWTDCGPTSNPRCVYRPNVCP